MSDAIAGFCLFNGNDRDCSVDAICRSSAGLEGWADYEKQQMNKDEPHIDDELSDCSEVIGPLVVPGDAPGFIAF